MRDQPKVEFQLPLEGGKYTYLRYADGSCAAHRHGEPWRDLTGDKLVGAMAAEISSLRAELAALKEQKPVASAVGPGDWTYTLDRAVRVGVRVYAQPKPADEAEKSVFDTFPDDYEV